MQGAMEMKGTHHDSRSLSLSFSLRILGVLFPLLDTHLFPHDTQIFPYDTQFSLLFTE